jgi:CRP-like cAMP-binding protein
VCRKSGIDALLLVESKIKILMNKCSVERTEMIEDHFDCKQCLFRKLSLCSDLEDIDLEILNKNKSDLRFKKNEFIFKQGIRPSGVYILAEGKVKNSKLSEHGFEQIVSLNKPVEFLGFFDFNANQKHSYSAIALEDCHVCYIPTKEIQEILRQNNAFALRILKYVSREFSLYIDRVTNLTGKHMRGRMADTLLYIYDFFDVAKSKDVLHIDLKRRDLADMAVMNTSNAVRTLSEFSKEEYITLEKHRIVFHNLSALQRISLNH